jgi:hypothetical protein
MLAIPEMRIKEALEAGFRSIANNNAVLDDVFANYPDALRLEAKQYLAENKIEVLLNWPREGQTQPCVAIVNAGEAEAPDKDVLGDFLEEVAVLGGDADLTAYEGIALNGTYQMLVLTKDPRLAVYMTYVVFTLLVLSRDNFLSAGMHNIVLNASDLRFEEQLLPEFSNSRMVTLTCMHYHAVPVTERLLTMLNVDVRLQLSVETP